jgi:hypothetical protein
VLSGLHIRLSEEQEAPVAGGRRPCGHRGQQPPTETRALCFRRLPDRDWSPEPGRILLAYALDLGNEALG